MPAKRVDFKYIKAKADFLVVLAHYNITLIGKGVERQALCPFHRETKPSFKVNLGRKVWNCFGCNQGGDIIKFVCLAEGLDPEEPDNIRTAAKKLATICDIEAAPPREGHAKRARKPAERAEEPETINEPSATRTPLPAAPAGSDGPINPPLKPEVIERIEAKLVREHPYMAARGLTAQTPSPPLAWATTRPAAA